MSFSFYNTLASFSFSASLIKVVFFCERLQWTGCFLQYIYTGSRRSKRNGFKKCLLGNSVLKRLCWSVSVSSSSLREATTRTTAEQTSLAFNPTPVIFSLHRKLIFSSSTCIDKQQDLYIYILSLISLSVLIFFIVCCWRKKEEKKKPHGCHRLWGRQQCWFFHHLIV